MCVSRMLIIPVPCVCFFFFLVNECLMTAVHGATCLDFFALFGTHVPVNIHFGYFLGFFFLSFVVVQNKRPALPLPQTKLVKIISQFIWPVR